MAKLVEADRVKIWAEFMRMDWPSVSLTKAALKGVVDGLDDWLEAQTTVFEATFPAGITDEMRLVLARDIINRRLEVIQNG